MDEGHAHSEMAKNREREQCSCNETRGAVEMQRLAEKNETKRKESVQHLRLLTQMQLMYHLVRIDNS